MNYALITGASSGIGRCYATLLAERGYNIIAVSNQDAELKATAKDIVERHGVAVETICIDLTERDAARTIFEHTEREGWQVDILVCNAGMLLFSTLVRTSPEALGRIVDLHCTTTTLLCRY